MQDTMWNYSECWNLLESSMAIFLKKYLGKFVEMLVMIKKLFIVLATGARTVNIVSQSHYI